MEIAISLPPLLEKHVFVNPVFTPRRAFLDIIRNRNLLG